MKMLALLSQILLGLLFATVGLNHFFHFLPENLMPAPPTEEAKQFMKLLVDSRYMDVVMGLEIAGGFALLTIRWTNLGMLLLGPIMVNIALFHFLLSKGRYEMPGIIALLMVIVLIRHWDEWKSALD